MISAESSSVEKVPDIFKVYCMETLDKCPDKVLDEDYGNSVKRFYGSEQHLLDNIDSSTLEYVSTQSSATL